MSNDLNKLLNAPNFIDFENMTDDVDDVDKFFDVDHESCPTVRPSRRETFEVTVPLTPQVMKLYTEDRQSMESASDKENKTPQTSRKRKNSKSETNISAETSTYMTPGTSSRKSHVAYMENGRSIKVLNYEGIEIVTPNKTHNMETRLDLVIKSPGLSLRTRLVTREQEKEEIADNNVSIRRSKRLQNLETIQSAVETTDVQPPVATTEEPQILTKGKSAMKPAVVPEARVALKAKRPGYRPPMVVTHPATKLATKAALPNKSVKFVAAAEVVHHFHKDTPARFHSRPANSVLQSKLQVSKPTGPQPNTIPKSPFLVTKARINHRFAEHIPTREERELQEVEEMKKHQVKAHPLKRAVLIPPPVKDIHNTKTPTRPEPFKLSQGKKKEPTPEPVFKFKAQAIPKGILESPKGVPQRLALPLTEPQSPNLRVTAKYPKRIRVETPGHVEKEVAHFGVENKRLTPNRSTPSRVTKVQPFSFEERDKQLLKMKEARLKQAEEENKKSRDFKATKKPNFKPPCLPERIQLPLTLTHTPQLSGFTRGVQNQLKLAQKVAEAEASKKIIFKAKPATVTHQKPFEPVLPKRLLPKVDLHLKTEQRAIERSHFEEIITLKEKQAAALKAEHEAKLAAEAREEEARLRREAEFKATEFKPCSPLKIHPSDKPLTEPTSPHLLLKERASRSIQCE